MECEPSYPILEPRMLTISWQVPLRQANHARGQRYGIDH